MIGSQWEVSRPMRNLLALISALLLLFALVGWYRGWYRVQNSPAAPGHHAVNIDIDKDKIGKDLHEGEEELQKVITKKLKEDSGKTTEKVPPDANTPNPKLKTKAQTKTPPRSPTRP
jgi:hypothetical protein